MQGVGSLLPLIQEDVRSITCLRMLINRSNFKRVSRSQHGLGCSRAIGDRRTKSRKSDYQDLNGGFPEMMHGQEK